MNSNDITKGILKAIAYIVGIALLLLFIYKIQSTILYIVIAAIISLIGLPIVEFLKTKLKFMPRPKGSQNKITSEVKDKLQLLIDDLIASLNVNE